MARVIGIALAGILQLGCGGGGDTSSACNEADDVSRQIKDKADSDMLDSNGLCAHSESEIEAMLRIRNVPSDPAVLAQQYVDACKKLQQLLDQCHGR